MDPQSIRLSQEVADALWSGDPVVALESALLSFGLPRPLNIETYLAMEDAVRASGAVPAGTAVLDGHPFLGLTRPQIERLADPAGCEKASLADMAWIAGTGRPGATTVAATMAIAFGAGCSVFATGGIGGVHPGVAEDLDISADITSLGRYPMAVVCSGAKAILDIPKTLELLEAAGVVVIGLGTSDFPLFYSRASGRRVRPVEDVRDAARVLRAQHRIGLPGGVLVGNPVPAAAALDRAEVDAWIGEAERAAHASGVYGRERTPFVLARLAELSGGRTVETNRALLVNNARVAGELAVAYATAWKTGL